MEQVKLKDFERDLRQCVEGDVSFDRMTLGIYATDASIYQLTAVAVVVPKDESDVCAAVRIAAENNVSILPRGAGTSLNGQGCSNSMIIDFSKYMNKILELNVEQRWVRVQPGIVLDELNAQLAEHGLMFAPDPATSSRATIGGIMGNNSSGTKSIIYGMAVDHVLGAKTLLADGTVLQLEQLCPDEYQKKCAGIEGSEREAQIYSKVKEIIEANRDEIEKKFPKVVRRVQGYNLDAFTNTDRWNLTRLLVGSEGSLGIFLDGKLNLEPLPKAKILCIVHFADLLEAIRTVAIILKHKPSAVEVLDNPVITMARQNLSIRPLTGFIEGDPAAILIVEFFGDSSEQALKRAEAMASNLKEQKKGYAWPIITQAGEQANVWTVRKNGLSLMLGIKGKRKPVPCIEDGCVPIEVLPEYIDRIIKFCRSRKVPLSVYAHASVGQIHLRPLLDLKVREDIDNMIAITEFAFELVKKYGGSVSGEHGDGRARSPLLERFFDKQIYSALREIKKLFDPEGLLNPGIIIDPDAMDENLRYGTDYKTPTEPTEYHYREDGSFAAAVEMCTGVGTCRQNLDGVMCPSYRATRNEEHSTRGRANALRLAMTGQLGPNAMTSKRLFEVLELCLSCKSCKSECPSNVDMTRLKSEFLQKYHDANGAGLRERMVRDSGLMASVFAGPFAAVINFIQRTWLFRKLLEIFAGFDSRRTAPAYASKRFGSWFKNHPKLTNAPNGKVVLFDDTYIKYHQSQIGVSAVELLESCGYEVISANAGCCQRPKISHGFLREAKKKGEKTLRNLDRFIEQGLKVVVCEPSCCSAILDDLPDLIDDVELGGRIKENVMMIDEFLAAEVKDGRLECEFTSPYDKIAIHGHCHRKALFDMTAMKYLLDRIPGMSVEQLDTGCCGMAGSFGFEKEHYELSMQIGAESLFPAVRSREEGSVVVACGLSCRDQIRDGTGVEALHWVESIRGKWTE